MVVFVYMGWNDVTYLWSQYDRHFVGQHRRTVRSLSGEDMSRYSNKIESVDLRKRPYYRYLTKNVMSE